MAQAHARRDAALVASGKLEYRNTALEGLPVPQSVEEQYDVLSLFEVIEHVADPAQFLEMCSPFVKPGGWIIMSTIARSWVSWVTTKLVAEDVLRIVPRGTHDWGKYINQEELRGWFLNARSPDGKGWNSPLVMGVVYVPGVGWKEVSGSEKVGNYFFGIRRDE